MNGVFYGKLSLYSHVQKYVIQEMLSQNAANDINLMQDDAPLSPHITKSFRGILEQLFCTTSSHAAPFYISMFPNYTPIDFWFGGYFKTKLYLMNL